MTTTTNHTTTLRVSFPNGRILADVLRNRTVTITIADEDGHREGFHGEIVSGTPASVLLYTVEDGERWGQRFRLDMEEILSVDIHEV